MLAQGSLRFDGEIYHSQPKFCSRMMLDPFPSVISPVKDSNQGSSNTMDQSLTRSWPWIAMTCRTGFRMRLSCVPCSPPTLDKKTSTVTITRVFVFALSSKENSKTAEAAMVSTVLCICHLETQKMWLHDVQMVAGKHGYVNAVLALSRPCFERFLT
jgi:hypothetical protein